MIFVETLITLLVIMDPIGSVPIFLSLTARAPQARTKAALQATLTAGGVIAVFAIFGEYLLRVLDVSLPALQVSGGLLLVLVALELLHPRSVEDELDHGMNVALVPLGTPLLAGPGAIAAIMVRMRDTDGAAGVAEVLAALAVTVLVVFLVLGLAAKISAVVKPNGIALVSRLVGLLLAAIAVQLVAGGIDTWVRSGV
ncbi:MAG: MarC family protein [Acidimicrobiia bacterium]